MDLVTDLVMPPVTEQVKGYRWEMRLALESDSEGSDLDSESGQSPSVSQVLEQASSSESWSSSLNDDYSWLA